MLSKRRRYKFFVFLLKLILFLSLVTYFYIKKLRKMFIIGSVIFGLFA